MRHRKQFSIWLAATTLGALLASPLTADEENHPRVEKKAQTRFVDAMEKEIDKKLHTPGHDLEAVRRYLTVKDSPRDQLFMDTLLKKDAAYEAISVAGPEAILAVFPSLQRTIDKVQDAKNVWRKKHAELKYDNWRASPDIDFHQGIILESSYLLNNGRRIRGELSYKELKLGIPLQLSTPNPVYFSFAYNWKKGSELGVWYTARFSGRHD